VESQRSRNLHSSTLVIYCVYHIIQAFLLRPNSNTFEFKAAEAADLQISLTSLSYHQTVLASRAWTLQERLLSPRTLYFGEFDLLWQCKTKCANGSFPDKFPPGTSTSLDSYGSGFSLTKSWNLIVQWYTDAHLTKDSDKLIAISGLARAAQQENKDEYFAGLWRTDMEYQLCWFHDDFMPTKLHRSLPTRAPTWSWASTDLSVCYEARDEHLEYVIYAHVVNVQPIPSGADPFNLCEGSLSMNVTALLSCKIPEGQGWGDILITSGGVDLLFTGSVMLDSYADDFNTGLFILPIFHHQNDYFKRVKGLVLYPTSSSKGEYSRIGAFMLNYMVYNEQESKENYKKFQKALKESGIAIAESHCSKILPEPKYAGERYMLTII